MHPHRVQVVFFLGGGRVEGHALADPRVVRRQPGFHADFIGGRVRIGIGRPVLAGNGPGRLLLVRTSRVRPPGCRSEPIRPGQRHLVRHEAAQGALAVRLEEPLQVGAEAERLLPADGEGELETPVVSIGIGEGPLPVHVRHGHLGGLPRGVDRRQHDHRHDHGRGGHGGEGRVVQREPREQLVFRDAPRHGLADEVAGHAPDDGVHGRLGHEERADMGRRQAHGAVHPDLAEALVDGVHHGVQDDEGGDDHGDEQVAQAGQGTQRHGAVHGDLAVHGGHHGDPQALHEAVQADSGRFVRGEPDRHGPQGSAEVVHVGLRRQDQVRRGQVLEPDHFHRFFLVVHQGDFREQIAAGRRVIDGGERLAVQVGDPVHHGRIEYADDREGLAEYADLPRAAGPFHRTRAAGPFRHTRAADPFRHTQETRHFGGNDAHVTLVAFEPPARHQGPVQPADHPLVGHHAQDA